jgi:predicted ATPase
MARELTRGFVERARRERPGLVVDPQNQQHVTELAQRLIDDAPATQPR